MESRRSRFFIVVASTVSLVFIGIFAGSFTAFAPTGPAAALISAAGATLAEAPLPDTTPRYRYIEVMDGCGVHYDGTCVIARTSPATLSPAALNLRTGIVLEVASTTIFADGMEWYKVIHREWLRYPFRVTGEWYVAADVVRSFTDTGIEELPDGIVATTTKRIVIKRSEQKLSAYDGDALFMETPISTGLDLTPTPRGAFTVYKKTPTRYMQGPLPGISDQYYDLPGVPWDLYFTPEGGAIHGAYWHNSFGSVWSHGCVNLPLEAARTLYYWTPVGTEVIVED